MSAFHLTRRALLAATVGLTVSSLGTLSQTQKTSNDSVSGSWPLGRGDSANTAATDATGPVESPSVRWTFDKHLVSRKPPVIADGRAYIGYFDDVAGFVALDAATGTELWKTTFGDESAVRFPDAAAAVGDNILLAPFGTVLIGIGPATGTERWRKQFEEEISAPVLTDQTAYLTVEGVGDVVALDATSGTIEWRESIGEWVHGGVAVQDSTVYAVGKTGREGPEVVTALNADNGTVRWQKQLDRSLGGPPAVEGDTVYVSHGRGLHALNRNDGTVRWEFQGHFVSGSERRNFSHAGSAPAVRDGVVCVGSPDNRVYAIDTATGEKRWEFWTWNNVTGNPVVAGNTVFVGSDDSFIYALDIETGNRRWEFDTEGTIDGAGGAVVENMLYISMWEDGLYALEGGA